MQTPRTDSNHPADSKLCPPAYRDAVKFSLVLQIPILVIAALMLDGGRLFVLVSIAAVAYWTVTLQIMLRRPAAPTRFDLLFIRYGVLLLSAVAAGIAPFVWELIGESTRAGWERVLGR